MLFVIRHGPTLWNEPPRRCQGQTDVPLSEEGRAAAHERASELPRFDAGYSSHLIRAKETAQIVLSRQSTTPPKIGVDPRLAEADCGRWEGELHDEIAQAWPDAWSALAAQDPAFTFPGGESLALVQTRFTQALLELDSRHPDETVLVVAHGGPMRLFMRARDLIGPMKPGTHPKNLEGFKLEVGRVRLVERP
jgi:broad specificity phosphatase PhoE